VSGGGAAQGEWVPCTVADAISPASAWRLLGSPGLSDASPSSCCPAPRLLPAMPPPKPSYVAQRSDPELLAWWARYCESRGAFPQALNCYQRTGAVLKGWGGTGGAGWIQPQPSHSYEERMTPTSAAPEAGWVGTRRAAAAPRFPSAQATTWPCVASTAPPARGPPPSTWSPRAATRRRRSTWAGCTRRAGGRRRRSSALPSPAATRRRRGSPSGARARGGGGGGRRHAMLLLPSYPQPPPGSTPLTPRYGLNKELLAAALQATPAVMVDAAEHLLAEGGRARGGWARGEHREARSGHQTCGGLRNAVPCREPRSQTPPLAHLRPPPPGEPEPAALLLRKAGRAARALEVANAAGLYALVHEIAGRMGGEGGAGGGPSGAEDAALQARWAGRPGVCWGC
jgi:hypothetical protein